MNTVKYKNNPKDAKKDKRLLFINPLNVEYKNKENNPIFQQFLSTFTFLFNNKFTEYTAGIIAV